MIQQSDKPLRFHASRKKMLLLLLLAAVFVALGVWMFPEKPIQASVVIVLCGLSIVISLMSLHPRGSYLEIAEEGFTCCSLFRSKFTAWEDVNHFYPMSIGNHPMVGWQYAAHYQPNATGRALSRFLTRSEAALPDTYGMDADTLAELMNTKLEARRPRQQTAAAEPARHEP